MHVQTELAQKLVRLKDPKRRQALQKRRQQRAQLRAEAPCNPEKVTGDKQNNSGKMAEIFNRAATVSHFSEKEGGNQRNLLGLLHGLM